VSGSGSIDICLPRILNSRLEAGSRRERGASNERVHSTILVDEERNGDRGRCMLESE
jgi:hypothetical protein